MFAVIYEQSYKMETLFRFWLCDAFSGGKGLVGFKSDIFPENGLLCMYTPKWCENIFRDTYVLLLWRQWCMGWSVKWNVFVVENGGFGLCDAKFDVNWCVNYVVAVVVCVARRCNELYQLSHGIDSVLIKSVPMKWSWKVTSFDDDWLFWWCNKTFMNAKIMF